MITQQQAIDAAIAIIAEMRKKYVPRDTGNMAYMALMYDIQNGTLTIYVNEDIAPYVTYTNEPWISPKWKGKTNPNQGWWVKFVEEFTARFTNRLGGKLQ